MADPQTDTPQPDIRAVLDPLPVGNDVKAKTWDAFHDASGPDDLRSKFDSLEIPQEAKAKLWDMKFHSGGGSSGPAVADFQKANAERPWWKSALGIPAQIDGRIAPPAQEDALKEGLGPAIETAYDPLIGAAKGAAHTALGATSLAVKATSKLPWVPKAVRDSAPTVPTDPEILKPTNTEQKIGNGMEQAAEFLAPAGAVGKVAKAADVAFAAKGVPSIVRAGLRIATRGALEGGSAAGVSAVQGGDVPAAATAGAVGGAAGQGLTEGASSISDWLKELAQKQYSKFLNPTKETTKNATQKIVPELLDRKVIATSPEGLADTAAAKTDEIGGQIGDAVEKMPPFEKPLAPQIKGLLPAAPTTIPLGENTPGEMPGALLRAKRPPIPDSAFSAESRMAAGDSGIPAIRLTDADSPDAPYRYYTTSGEGEVLPPEKSEAGVMITRDPAIANRFSPRFPSAATREAALPKPAQSVIDHLEDYKNGFLVNGSPVNPQGEHALAAASGLQDVIRNLGPDVSYQSLNRVRQLLDSGVAKAGGYLGKSLADGSTLDAEKEAANAIRAELSKASPDIAKLNAEYSFWRKVGDVAGQTAQRQTGQQGPLARIFAPIIGGAAGFAHGGDTMHALTGAAALTIGNEIIRSPLYRTASAVLKNELADALARGDVSKVAGIATRLGAGAASQDSAAANKHSDIGFVPFEGK